MCLAAPVKIVQLDKEEAVVDAGGVRRRINVSFIREPQLGEWVLAHAGFAIQRWTQGEVDEYNQIMDEMARLE